MGKKKIGLALANTKLKIISPLKNISNDGLAITKIIQIISRYSVNTVVIGLPIFPISKQYNELYPLIKSFSNKLKKQAMNILQKKITIIFVEEEYSTQIAKIKYNPKKQIDKYSATIILENYLGGNYENINP